jgi:hypothetical protein
MASVQAQFEAFHEAIKLKRFEDNATLREKRDAVLDKLKDRLPGVFAAHGKTYPTPTFRDQGSYEMGTGIKPLSGDFDIDEGVYFPIGTSDYPDPVVLKDYVYEALDGHTKDIRIRRSCVTVFYQRSGEHIYHVDLAVYADGSKDADGKARLAKGKTGSSSENRNWEVSNPAGLSETILGKFSSGPKRDQFRRVVRYLKRWRDREYASASGNAIPSGIALTVGAYWYFAPVIIDTTSGQADDLAAIRTLIDSLLGRFTSVWDSQTQQLVRRLRIDLPVEPWGDLLARMTNTQMATFEQKLTTLKTALDTAHLLLDPVEACTELRKVFGGDFPVPTKQETAKVHAPAIVSSSNSA